MDRHFDHLRRRNLRASTIQQRRYALMRLQRWTGKHPFACTIEDIRGYLDRFTVAESRATETSHIRSFYRWAYQERLIDHDPSLDLERPRLQRRLPRPIPDADLARAIDTADDRTRTMLMLAALGGLRACEIASLRAENVLLRHQPPIMVIEGKGGKMRVVPVHPRLQVALATLPKNGWCFPRRDGRPGHLPPHRVSHLVNRHLHGLGITHTLHTLRHWFATRLYQLTGDLRLVQEQLGHATPTSTQIYTWVDPGRAVEAVHRLDLPDDPPSGPRLRPAA